MHLAFIIDHERLAQEQVMLNRLCIGLMSESVKVTRIVPESLPPELVHAGEQQVALADRIESPMRVLPWMRRNRVHEIVEQFDKQLPDVLYAIGAKAWQLGIDLASAMQRPVMIDVWSLEQVKLAPRHSESPAIAGYIAPCKALADALSTHVDAALVNLVPMGVAVPPSPRTIMEHEDRPAAIAIIGGSRDRLAYQAVLGGLCRVIKKFPTVQVFLELRGPHEHEIWRLAEELELMSCVSAIGESALYRTLLTRCDLLLMPERLGEPRSIMLEAMALGMSIICGNDPMLDMLIDGETARFVTDPQPSRWADHMIELLGSPMQARTLGAKARLMVESRHRSTEQVSTLLTVLERAAGQGSYRFAGVLP